MGVFVGFLKDGETRFFDFGMMEARFGEGISILWVDYDAIWRCDLESLLCHCFGLVLWRFRSMETMVALAQFVPLSRVLFLVSGDVETSDSFSFRRGGCRILWIRCGST